MNANGRRRGTPLWVSDCHGSERRRFVTHSSARTKWSARSRSRTSFADRQGIPSVSSLHSSSASSASTSGLSESTACHVRPMRAACEGSNPMMSVRLAMELYCGGPANSVLINAFDATRKFFKHMPGGTYLIIRKLHDADSAPVLLIDTPLLPKAGAQYDERLPEMRCNMCNTRVD